MLRHLGQHDFIAWTVKETALKNFCSTVSLYCSMTYTYWSLSGPSTIWVGKKLSTICILLISDHLTYELQAKGMVTFTSLQLAHRIQKTAGYWMLLICKYKGLLLHPHQSSPHVVTQGLSLQTQKHSLSDISHQIYSSYVGRKRGEIVVGCVLWQDICCLLHRLKTQ
jgi:hypothetical protein